MRAGLPALLASRRRSAGGQVPAAVMREAAAMAGNPERTQRLHILLSREELVALDNFRFTRRMPSRASAARELLRRALAADTKEHRKACKP
jgi:hypothetical protein